MWIHLVKQTGAFLISFIIKRVHMQSQGLFRFNTLRPRQNGRHFADDIFNCIFLNGNVRISIKFSLKFVLKDPINSIPALVQIMAWRRPGDKPLSEPMMFSLLTHICVTRPQWVKESLFYIWYSVYKDKWVVKTPYLYYVNLVFHHNLEMN